MATGLMLLRKVDAALIFVGAAAAVFTVAALATVGAAEPGGNLEDVQIGERGEILRVALICSTRCDVVPDAGVNFRINGVVAELDVDLGARSALARRLTIVAEDGASLVKLDPAARINEARVVSCRSDTGLAPCIEYRFDPPSRAAGKAAPVAAKIAAPAPAIRDDSAAGERAGAIEKREDMPFIGAIILSPGPVLREEPAGGVLHLPQFAPPERLAPPKTPPKTSEKSPQKTSSAPSPEANAIPANVDIARPSLLAVDRAGTIGAGAAFDIRREAAELLGKTFSVGACEGAKARLQGDAWALDAMIDLAYCKAANGKLEEADADFARLLAYTPDNYEALVGRGMIALASGEREMARAFYQEALNALPPIAESDRIVAAMDRI